MKKNNCFRIGILAMMLSIFSNANAQTVADIYSLDQYQSRVHQDNDTLYVVNFWATWCAPCVQEMPYFVALSKEYAHLPIKFVLVSLDAKDKLDGVRTFLRRKEINLETHLLSAGDPNVWINALEPSWQGSIPATFLYQKGAKLNFKESSFENQKELASFIKNK